MFTDAELAQWEAEWRGDPAKYEKSFITFLMEKLVQKGMGLEGMEDEVRDGADEPDPHEGIGHLDEDEDDDDEGDEPRLNDLDDLDDDDDDEIDREGDGRLYDEHDLDRDDDVD